MLFKYARPCFKFEISADESKNRTSVDIISRADTLKGYFSIYACQIWLALSVLSTSQARSPECVVLVSGCA